MKVNLIVLGEFDSDFPGDGQGHFPLQSQDAAAFPVVLVSPKRLIGPPVHEADTDPNLIPSVNTEPSITASTPSSRAISGIGLRILLYCMAEVREITCRASIWARSAINASVMPSAK